MKKEIVTASVKKQFSVQKITIFIVSILLFVVALSLAIYFYNQYRSTQKLLKDPTLVAQEEIKTVIKEVGKLIELPKNEQPTLATVSDKTKLESQSFFKNAENGDKVLLYTNAKKAILYRPSINKIIEVSSINIGPNPTSSPNISTTPSPTQMQQVKIALYNGTKTAGLASTTEKQITEKYANMSVVLKSNTKSDYTKTLVVDLTGTNNNSVQELVSLLGGEVGQFPLGETKPDADILVILGK